MSLTKAPESATAAPAQALTTAFAAPSGCVDNFILANVTNVGSSTESLAIFVSAPVDPRFAACQPSGWDREKDNTSFAFSPAVCPSSWTAYELAQNYLAPARNGNHTAKCCSSGFELLRGVTAEGLYDFQCGRTQVSNATTTVRTSTVTTGYVNNTAQTSIAKYTSISGTTALSIHNAWLIWWDSQDASTLSPSPPVLQCTESTVYTWVPGETVPPGGGLDKCGPGENVLRLAGLGGFLIIGLPIICVFLLASCGSIFCLRYRHRKHKKLNLEMQAVAAADLRASSQVPEKQENQAKQ